MGSVPIITGYYRYTDIWFEWHQAVPNPDDRAPLKAILAHDALTHPNHPLRRQGEQGINMHLGTFHDGASRLLFSSKQVDYVRYWLHKMGLTSTLIPLPYSECLLTESNLRNVSPVVYKDGGSLKLAIKKIDKNNKRLKGSNPLLTSRRDLFERVRTFWADKQGTWCAIDFEDWERDHSAITEFGWSSIHWDEGKEVENRGHVIVKEHEKLFNSTYMNVPAGTRDNYNFGKSQVVTKAALKNFIHELLSNMAQQQGPVYLVFHDCGQDIKTLKSKAIDAPLENLSYILPDATPDEGFFVVDTSDLFGALEGEANNRRSLDRVCKHLQIPTTYLHNAGNDAEYTLLCLKSMASGDPVDTQRDKRWPGRLGDSTTTRGVKVQFKPYEEDSDYSDEEGVAHYQISGYNGSTGQLNNQNDA